MKVLVACEYSGVVREAFRKLGHDAYSCDILPTDVPSPYHIQDDVLKHLNEGWELMVGHPPCTYLCVTGNSWMLPKYKERFPTRQQDRKDAIDFFLKLAKSDIPRIAIENPVGIMSTFWREPDQYIQPWMFGEAQTKKTGLWLKNLPKLRPTNIVTPKVYLYKDGKKKGRGDPFWHVESMRLPPLERMKVRSKTFQGIADAMASQWGNYKEIQLQLVA
jgi:hypothetical protein